MTWLAEDPALWDAVFHEPAARTRFITRLARGGRVLDVGCATGALCRALARRGIATTGVDVNPAFIAAARGKLPGAAFVVGDMATFHVAPRADLTCCLGTTLAYKHTSADVLASLENFRRHTRPGGQLVLDVLNASAVLRRFRPRTRHVFSHGGRRVVATITHGLELARQLLTEQVTWRAGRTVRHDPVERLRLFFPQELAHLVASAGFRDIELFDGYGTRSRAFDGRRLVVVARAPLSRGRRAPPPTRCWAWGWSSRTCWPCRV
ncbi:MAG TPA: class I SAM-dependent methyltransferase, partial [Kofleriaceae bacterium]|nr:class I SAM-dependent methyltransferase [Kofleriaceae bacterium]